MPRIKKKKEKRSIVRQFHKSQLKITKSVLLTNRAPTRQTAVLQSVYVIIGPGSTVCFYAMDYILGRSSLGWQRFLMHYLPRFGSGLCQFHLLWPFLHIQLSSKHDTQAALSTALSNQHWEPAYQQLCSNHLLQKCSESWPVPELHVKVQSARTELVISRTESPAWRELVKCMEGKGTCANLIFWKRVGKYHYSCASLTEIQ